MELLILNTDLIAVDIQDKYESLIWTDRYDQYGDFELKLPMDSSLLSTLQQNYYVYSSKSEHLMIIEKIEIDSDIEDGNSLIVTGRSLESILDRRIIWEQKTYSGNLQDAIKSMLNDAFISPPSSLSARKIDNFVFEPSTDSRITELTIDAQYTGDNLYDVIYALCSENEIGFKITLNDSNQFVFKLYVGENRSYDQDTLPWVVFSKKFDNLEDSNYYQDNTSYKNVVLVGGEGEGSLQKFKIVTETTSDDITGLNRRETYESATDVSSSREDTKVFSSGTSDYGITVYDNSAQIGEYTYYYKTGTVSNGLKIYNSTAKNSSSKLTPASSTIELYSTEKIDFSDYAKLVVVGSGFTDNSYNNSKLYVTTTSGYPTSSSESYLMNMKPTSRDSTTRLEFNLETILHKHIGYLSLYFEVPSSGSITNIYLELLDEKKNILKISGSGSNIKLYTTSTIDFTNLRTMTVSGSNITNGTTGKLVVRSTSGYDVTSSSPLLTVSSTKEKATSSDSDDPETVTSQTYDFSELSHAVTGYLSILIPTGSYDSDSNPSVSSITLNAIQLTDDEYYDLLAEKGTTVLNENTDTVSFEGEIDTNTMFKYGTDYTIGDQVQIVDEYGNTGKTRVTEIVYSHDSNGISYYPTFTTLE